MQYTDAVKAFDIEMHGLNDEIEAVAIKKNKEKFDPSATEAALKRLEPALKRLQDASTNLIQRLQ